MINRKEPEPQFIISAPALGGNLFSAPWLSAPAPQHWNKVVAVFVCQLTVLRIPLSNAHGPNLLQLYVTRNAAYRNQISEPPLISFHLDSTASAHCVTNIFQHQSTYRGIRKPAQVNKKRKQKCCQNLFCWVNWSKV